MPTLWPDVGVALPPHWEVVCLVSWDVEDPRDGDLLDAPLRLLNHLGLQGRAGQGGAGRERGRQWAAGRRGGGGTDGTRSVPRLWAMSHITNGCPTAGTQGSLSEGEGGGARQAAGGRRRRGVMVHCPRPIPPLLRQNDARRPADQNGAQPPPTFSLSASSAAWLCTTSRAGKPSVESSCEMSVMSSSGLLASSGRARKALPAVARVTPACAGVGASRARWFALETLKSLDRPSETDSRAAGQPRQRA